MNIVPTLHAQLAGDHQRELLAQASRRRLAREVRRTAIASRQGERARPRTRRLFGRTRPVICPS
jgi:hypothetical protein